MTEGAVLRVLASVGTQMAAFVHEINNILGMSKALEAAVAEIERELSLIAAQRRKLAQLRSAIEDVRPDRASGIVSDGRHFAGRPSPSFPAETGRTLRCRTVVWSRLWQHGDGVEIKDEIPADLQSPPMFPAELTVIFSNLLTNAVKAAGESGGLRASGRRIRRTCRPQA